MSLTEKIFSALFPSRYEGDWWNREHLDQQPSESTVDEARREALCRNDFMRRLRAGLGNRESRFARMSPSRGCSRDAAFPVERAAALFDIVRN